MACVHDYLYNFSVLTCKHADKPENETISILYMGGGGFETIKSSSGKTGAVISTMLQVL